MVDPWIMTAIFERHTYFAPSALPRIIEPLPGALPQAVTFRAFGTETLEFSHSLYRSRFYTGSVGFKRPSQKRPLWAKPSRIPRRNMLTCSAL